MDYYHELIQKIGHPERYKTILGAAIASVTTIYLFKRVISGMSKKKSAKFKGIPVPKGEYFYLGHAPLLGKRPGEVITKWHQEYGPIIKIKMGVQNWLLLGDPQVSHEILVSKGLVTAGRPEHTFLGKIHGKGGRGVVMVDYGEKWKDARNALLHILSPKSVDSLSNIIEREAEKGVKYIVELAKSDGAINPLDFSRFIAMNLMFSVAFNIPGTESFDDPTFKEMLHFVERNAHFIDLSNDASVMFPIMKLPEALFGKEKKMRRYVDDEYFPFMRRIIKRARESDGDSLVKKVDSIKNEHRIDEIGVTVLMSEILSAGSDTVALSMTWSIALLCNHPDVQEKIYQEIKAFIKEHGRHPTFADREAMPYFIAFQKECVRYRPGMDLGMPHKATEDFFYKDSLIPKGTILVSNLHTLHSDPNNFADADKFMPERYLDDTRSMYAASKGNYQTRDHYTFGWGRRICPGIYMAEGEMFYTITKLISRCIIKPELSSTGEELYPDLQCGINTGISITPVPFKIRLIKRDVDNNN
ncbi:hypothetical protein RMATCC62417_07956 [Rhizopus microsporus]|nr:hypothetical protein RMATCC62417_07956 [Rhizopus microsporus]